MVQPNIKIFTIKYISSNVYSDFEKKINKAAKDKKIQFKFDFEGQYFDIKGRSQQACDDFAQLVEENLLPALHDMVADNKFHGTFEDLELIQAASASTPTTPSTTRASSPDVRVTPGRPFAFEQNGAGTAEVLTHDYYDTESDDPAESDDEFVETFTFAKNVSNPKEILTSPTVANNKPGDYLRIIGNDTETECSLIDRQIKIVGKSEEDVKEALQRFRNLQTFYKRRKRGLTYVPCVHYTGGHAQFGLYFCSLERYAQRAFVDLLNMPASPLYVIIPSIKNNQGVFQKPRELLDAPPQGHMPPQQQQWVQRQQLQQQQQREQEMSLDERMRLASLEFSGKKAYGNVSAGLAPDQRPLWGENKTFVTNASAQVVRAGSSSRAPMPPPAVVNQEPKEDFPALGATTPKVVPKKSPARRVMRITNQKSSSGSSSPDNSIINIVKDYNFNNIKTALEDGLESVRGFKGDIKISAKLGKILWSQVTPDIQKQVWQFQDLKDILMKEKGVKPNFNDITTFSDDIINKISELLPSPYSKSAYFEIHGKARNQPILPYQPVVMHVNQGVVEFKKIVTGVNKVTEIDWVSLERKFDFRILLSTEETTRSDVKPFSTFLRKISISPVTRQITYENVPDFLEVDYILSRQTTKYRIFFPLVVEITRIEKLPLIPQKYDKYGIEKILGDTGNGQVWYELEIYYTTFDEIFKGNNDLPAGKLASWTVKDVLGEDNEALTLYIRTLITLVERIEKLL